MSETPTPSEASLPAVDTDPKQKIRVLIVDDQAGLRKILGLQLNQLIQKANKGEALVIEEAEDGEEGLGKFKTEPYNWVFSDWNMPKMKGVEMAQGITEYVKGENERRHQEGEPLIPVPQIALVTGGDSGEMLPSDEQLKTAGIGHTLLKPYRMQQVEELIDGMRTQSSII